MLFRSPRCYFRCMAGASHERAPNFSCPALYRPHSFKKKKNATRKQSLIENINVLHRVCLQIAQSYVYALKLPNEVKIFSH